ncbi:unnamed protein product, partial [Meganyctiphanes norvegica]
NMTASKTLTVEKSLLTFNPTKNEYYIGQEANLDCGIIGLYETCQWEHRDDIYQVTDVMNGSYSYMNAQSNSSTNQCRVTISHLRTNHTGVWTCRVLAFGYNMTASKTLTVDITGTRTLRVDSANYTLCLSTLLAAIDHVQSCTLLAGARNGIYIRLNHIKNMRERLDHW